MAASSYDAVCLDVDKQARLDGDRRQ